MDIISLLSHLPTRVQALSGLRNPTGWRELFEDIKTDRLTKEGKVSCKNHLFFIAGLPKSGTTWLEQLLSCTPGLVQLNKSCLRAYPKYLPLDKAHGLHPGMINCAPRDRLSYLKLHIEARPDYLDILSQYEIKTTILIRDLRDMLVSRYHHVLNQKSHWGHSELVAAPKEQRFITSLNQEIPREGLTVFDYYCKWILDWVNCTEEQDQFLLMRYEDLKEDTELSLAKLLDFYQYPTNDSSIEDIIEKHHKAFVHDHDRSLKSNLGQAGRRVSTLRKGKVGGWRELIDSASRDLIKKKAGKLLIQTQYEGDLNW